MKKLYEAPEVEEISFTVEDLVTGQSGIGSVGGSGGSGYDPEDW